jgi:diguanylate cyclase (GGDEF)-like protein/PAS domain S-box-containing protein
MDIYSSGRNPGRSFGLRDRLVLYFGVTWLGVALVLAFVLYEGRRDAELRAPAEALGKAAQLESRLAATMRPLQGTLDYLAASLPRDAFRLATVGRFREGIAGELELFSRQFPEVAGFRVADASGNVLYASEGALSAPALPDRARFSSSPPKAVSSLAFSDVIADKSSGRGYLFVTRSVLDAQGGVLGQVTALLDKGMLSKMVEAVDVGAKGVVAVALAADGRLLLRLPATPDAVNLVPESDFLHRLIESGENPGTVRVSGVFDSVERVYAFRRIADYPLYVAGGLAVEDVLAEWRKTLAVSVALALVLFLVLSLVLIRLLRAESAEEATARKLMESEARYRMLAENSHDVIWTLDIPSRRYTYVSPSVTEMCGYLPDEVVGQSIDSRLTPESAARLARDIDQRLRRIAAGDKSASVVVTEQEQVCKDGDVISTEVVSSYLIDTDGVAHTILGITRNVSERKAAELALRETNRQLQARIDEIGRLQVALQELAVRDSLTGLYNRRYLDETLDREVSRARREGNPLSLVMLDIDYFKRVNDTYGHQVGDEVLRILATTLLADIRAEDVACRYGGEEFLVLLPNMPLDTAVQRAEAWRQSIQDLAVVLGNFHITFTISLGVAAYPEHGKTPDDLTRCADQALYRAKNEGRNQVSVIPA